MSKRRIQTSAASVQSDGVAEPALNLFFVAGLAALLGAAALPMLIAEDGGAGTPQNLFRALLWIIALALLYREGRGVGRRTTQAGLGVLVLFALLSFSNMGRLHQRGRFLHHHELFNYCIGSKYAPELGHEGLYYATHRALIENDPSLHEHIAFVTNLRSYQVEGRNTSLQRAENVAALFTAERWQSFKRDVAAFQQLIVPEAWGPLLLDHGYNATPFWTWIGSQFSTRSDFSAGSLLLLALLDPLLLLGALLLVYLAFGSRSALLFALFFFANFFATFDFTGGAFLRQLWFAALIAFVCCWQRERWILAGIGLGIAGLDRLFPLVFLLLPSILLLRAWSSERRLDRGSLRTLAACGLTLVILGGASVLFAGGLQAWTACIANIRNHSDWFFSNQVSLRSLFVINPLSTLEMVRGGWDESAWMRERAGLAAGTHALLSCVRLLMLGAVLLWMLRERKPRAILALITFLPFLLFYPANYYYSFLVIPILCMGSVPRLAQALMGLQALLWLLFTQMPPPLYLELLHWAASLALVALFLGFLVHGLSMQRAPQGPPRRSLVILIGLGAASLIVALMFDARQRVEPGGVHTLDLSPDDVFVSNGAPAKSERLTAWGPGWSGNDHVVCFFDGEAPHVSLEAQVLEGGSYDVRVDYSTSPGFGIVRLHFPNGGESAPINLFTPRLGMRSVIYPDVTLRQGANELLFQIVGKDPAAQDQHLAIDRVLLQPVLQTARSAEQALTRALEWLHANPSDDFDGGRRGVCAEILALAAVGADEAIQSRIDVLNASPSEWMQASDGEAFAAALHVVRGLGRDLPLFEEVAEDVRSWSQSADPNFPARSFYLGQYLARLAGQEPPQDVRRSAFFSEYSSRALSALSGAGLASRFNRSQVPRMTSAYMTIVHEICAISDYGREALPRGGVYADRPFWGMLCAAGLAFAHEVGDTELSAQLILLTHITQAQEQMPSLPSAVADLIAMQEQDGSFGPTRPTAPNPRRAAVLAAILALAASTAQ